MKKLLFGVVVASAATMAQAQALVDVTAPGDQIYGVQSNSGNTQATVSAVAGPTFGNNTYPGGENPGNAIDDNNGTKYLNFAGTSTNLAAGMYPGLIVTPSMGSTVLDDVQFVTGNDSPDRDPLTVSIYGSNSNPQSGLAAGSTIDTSGYSLIYSGVSGLATDPGRNTAGANVTFPNSAAYTSYEVLVTGVRGDPGETCCEQFSEINLSGSAAPVPEPASLALVGVGALGLLVRRRRA